MEEKEKDVLNKLVEAHQAFCELNENAYHKDEIFEWCSKLHDLQRIVMSRVAVRSNPEYFVNHSK